LFVTDVLAYHAMLTGN